MSDTTMMTVLHPAGEAQRFVLNEPVAQSASCRRPTGLRPTAEPPPGATILEKLGVVSDLAQRFPVPRTSPNATPVANVLQTFMFNCLMGGRRFAHARRCRMTKLWPSF